jgi:hypothetical protein
VEEDPCHRHAMEVSRYGGGGPTPPSRHGGGGPVPPPHCGVGGPMPPPRHGGGPTPWRRRSPPSWRRAIVEDPEGDEMPTHAEDKPSDCYSSSNPWRAPAVELPRPLESSSSHSSLESSNSDRSRPYQLILVFQRERDIRMREEERSKEIFTPQHEREKRNKRTQQHEYLLRHEIFYPTPRLLNVSRPCLQNFLSRTYFWCRPY